MKLAATEEQVRELWEGAYGVPYPDGYPIERAAEAVIATYGFEVVQQMLDAEVVR